MSSKKRTQASSAAAAAALGGKSGGFGFGHSSSSRSPSSPLSYFAEPPDIKSISDPNLVVVFSNLLKRDDTTKEKALADLFEWLNEQKSIENAIVNCYVQLYPKLSFENTIRIRQLAHKILGSIAEKTRRAFVPYLPQVTGSWLAGLYDSDQAVSSAATEALRQVFTTDEKISLVWKTYQMAIMDFCGKVKANERVETLSDERNNSPDEMETKFARVMKGVTLAAAHLVSAMAKMGAQEAKHDEAYLTFMNEQRLWTFAYHPDPYLRQAVYSLLRACLVNRKDYVEPALHVIAPAMLDKALTNSQLGSNQKYLDTLLTLNEVFPNSWEIAATAKKPTFKVIKRYVGKGSQGAPSEFWSKFASLFQTLPEKALPSTGDEVQQILKAIADGLSGSMEPKDHRSEAWNCYFQTCAFLLSKEFLSEPVRTEIVTVNIGNPFKEFLVTKEDLALWRIGLADPPVVLAKGMKAVTEVETSFVTVRLEELFNQLSQLVEAAVETSTNGDARVIEKNIATIEAWARLTSALYHNLDKKHWSTATLNSVEQELLRYAVTSSKASRGANIAAAALVASIAKSANSSVRRHASCRVALHEYLVDNSQTLVASPAREHFFNTLFAYQKHWDTSKGHGILEETVDLLVISENRDAILQFMYNFERSHTRASLASANLDEYLRQECEKAMTDADETSWKIVIVTFQAPESLVSRQLKADMVTKLAEKLHTLTLDLDYDHALVGNILTELSRIPAVVLASIIPKLRQDLIKTLLLIFEAADEDITKKANILFVKLCGEKNMDDADNNQIRTDIVTTLSSLVLEQINGKFIGIKLLVQKALCVLSHADLSREGQLMSTMAYSTDTWRKHLQPVFGSLPDASLSALSSLGDSLFLINSVEESDAQETTDSDKLTISMRMTTFMLSILSKSETSNPQPNKSVPHLDFQNAIAAALPKLDSELQWAFLRYSLIVAEIIADRQGVPDETVPVTNTVMQHLGADLEVIRYVSVQDAKNNVSILSAGTGTDGVNFANTTLLGLSKEASVDPITCEAYYHARALSSLVEILRRKGLTGKDAVMWVDALEIGKKKDNKLILRDAAVLSGLRDDEFTTSPAVVQLRNRLISDISGIEAEDAIEKAFPKLVLLNEIWTSDMVESPNDIPPQRGLLLMKKVLSWLNEELPPEVLAMQCPGLLCAIMRMSKRVLPVLRKIQGAHWRDLFVVLEDSFSAMCNTLGETVAVLLSTFSVYEAVKEIRATNQEDEYVNDDLSEQIDWYTPRLYRIWLSLLTDIAAPLQNEAFKQYCAALSRALMNMPLSYLDDSTGVGPRPSVSREDRDEADDSRPQSEKIYHLMAGNTDDVQGIAFNLLHRRIPQLQEQVSIDAALSKDETFEVQLPDELLSLLLDPPAMEEDAILNPAVLELPELQRIQGYLNSWVLVYDHFMNSSFRIKAGYVESLKSGDYIHKLLNFVFRFLGHARSKPIDGNKYPISSFDPTFSAYQPPDLHYIRTLMVYVYYLSLRYSPSLVKNWFSNSNNQVKDNVEPFTDKFISPLLVELEIKEVEKWLDSSDERPEGLAIKISRTVREITVTYEVDETTMEMMVKLPASFPLQLVEVKGVRRVAVSEKQWKTWLLACQAVIALQGGSIVDGLTLFQRNVKLHLDGVEECAICYSILAQVERTLPSKGCGTCKRKFHGSCLMRWFKSSSSSSCPLCRSSFQFI